MIGQRIGSYRLIREIGSGGMGSVYEGLREDIGRRVAIKVLLPKHSSDPLVASRFFMEARAVSIIDHPGLVSILEYGHTEEKLAYLVMEYIEGETLRARLRPSNPPLGVAALRLTSQVAQALAATHSKQIVHRDLKPDNIMLVADNLIPGGLRAKVLDFGIAKVQGLDEADAMSVKTRTGTLIGTPTYMSPEQCRSNPRLDGQADIYALGIILFEMLVGTPPFVSSALGELMALHLFAPPEGLREVLPNIPIELERLVLRMLSKRPAERPTALGVVEELARIVVSDEQLTRAADTDDRTQTAISEQEISDLAAQASVQADEKNPKASAPVEPISKSATIDKPARRRTSAALQLGLAAILLGGSGVAWWSRSHRRPQPVTTSAALTLPSNPGSAAGATPKTVVHTSAGPEQSSPLDIAARKPQAPPGSPDPVAGTADGVRALLARREPAKALLQLKPLLRQQPKSASLHELACQANLALGKRKPAVTSCERALALDSGLTSAQRLLAEAKQSRTVAQRAPKSTGAQSSTPAGQAATTAPKSKGSDAYNVDFLQ